MERADLVPGSAEWKENRNKKGTINASSAGSFIGINDADRLFSHIKDPVERGQLQIKQNFEYLKDYSKNTFDGNWWTRRGQFYEPTSIKLFEKVTGVVTKTSNSWQDGEYDWLFSTPDFLIEKQTAEQEFDFGRAKAKVKMEYNDSVGEVKNPSSQLHSTVPPHYMCQIQIQLRTTGRRECYFISTCMKLNKARIWLVPFSDEYWNWLLPQLKYLHDEALKDTPTDELDFSKFDFKPPYVNFTLLKEINGISNIVPVEPYPEAYPYKKWAGKRKTEDS